ncbi:hypothetical protein D623_10015495 [Myotis brandtii]|uniref:Uncharacterized protein n=1 Tax=Myotis brandtii TaxID=109478 RepID=S7NKY3_MYOBR|nr:hypothetical protein D623_10015495 [Myotis brandtii]
MGPARAVATYLTQRLCGREGITLAGGWRQLVLFPGASSRGKQGHSVLETPILPCANRTSSELCLHFPYSSLTLLWIPFADSAQVLGWALEVCSLKCTHFDSSGLRFTLIQHDL